jgi:hypothetical protein
VTYLNGQVVDPLATANPMEFCVLGTVMTEPSNHEVYYTDTHWEGKIGELVLYDRDLTSEEMKGVSEFLRKKWISVADLESPKRELVWDGIILDVEPNEFDPLQIKVFPNPATDQFTIHGMEKDDVVQLLDISGKYIRDLNNQGSIESIATYPNGIYFIKIIRPAKGLIVIKPVVKQ